MDGGVELIDFFSGVGGGWEEGVEEYILVLSCDCCYSVGVRGVNINVS